SENAISLVRPKIPKPEPEQLKQILLYGIKRLHELGVTSVHSMDAGTTFADLQDLRNEAKLKLRVFHAIPLRHLEPAVQIGLRTGLGDDLLRFGPVKIFSDGALGSQTALMLQPYDEI